MARGWRPWTHLAVVAFLALDTISVPNSPLPVASADSGSPMVSIAESPGGTALTARQQLARLTVRPPGPITGYSRDKFQHWVTVFGSCSTRETVLQRDGQHVKVDSECRPVSGSWFSPYDGQAWTHASDVDIDHVVPLAEAWRSGAAQWAPDRRRQFANDLTHHQLVIVTDTVNQAKGDKPPDKWKPPLRSYWCTYSMNWIDVKHAYALSTTSEEKTALATMLNTCPPTQ